MEKNTKSITPNKGQKNLKIKKIKPQYYFNNQGVLNTYVFNMIKVFLLILEAREEFMTIFRCFFGGIEAKKNCNSDFLTFISDSFIFKAPQFNIYGLRDHEETCFLNTLVRECERFRDFNPIYNNVPLITILLISHTEEKKSFDLDPSFFLSLSLSSSLLSSGTIHILRQHIVWVGGFRKWWFLLTFYAVFMLT